jgi:hypothetical protein
MTSMSSEPSSRSTIAARLEPGVGSTRDGAALQVSRPMPAKKLLPGGDDARR